MAQFQSVDINLRPAVPEEKEGAGKALTNVQPSLANKYDMIDISS
jgi:hypothetical protein